MANPLGIDDRSLVLDYSNNCSCVLDGDVEVQPAPTPPDESRSGYQRGSDRAWCDVIDRRPDPNGDLAWAESRADRLVACNLGEPENERRRGSPRKVRSESSGGVSLGHDARQVMDELRPAASHFWPAPTVRDEAMATPTRTSAPAVGGGRRSTVGRRLGVQQEGQRRSVPLGSK
jgi:hypothetical protein